MTDEPSKAKQPRKVSSHSFGAAMHAIAEPEVSQPALRRLPLYFGFLKEQQEKGVRTISSSTIADNLNLHPVQVRKDLSLTQVSGKPRAGFSVDRLLEELSRMLDYHNLKNAVLVGCGQLGRALLNYPGFRGYGLNFIAAFDQDRSLVGEKVGPAQVYAMEELSTIIRRYQVHIAVLTVPASAAQAIAEELIRYDIRAIWNFAPVFLQLPEEIIVQNENIAASLSVLSKRLSDQEKRLRV